MRRAAVIGLILLLAIAGLIVRPSRAQTPSTETIKVKEGFGSGTVLQGTRPHRVNAGDVYILSAPLFSSGQQVGRERYVCTVHVGSVHDSHNTLCAVELKITGRGRVEAQGNIHLGKQHDVLGVTGGTGDFSDVAGTVQRAGRAAMPTVTINLIYH